MSMGTSLRSYYRGHSLVSMRDGQASASRYYHFDAQGTTQCLTNEAGAVTDRFSADAWGVEVRRTGASINRHWYVGDRGYLRDTADSTYVRRRMSIPELGRWMSRDPLHYSPEPDPYMYVRNKPALYTDPSGLLTITSLEPVQLTDCGGADWRVRFGGLKKGDYGWIIQHIKRTPTVRDCAGVLIPNPKNKPVEFWEAWQVKDGFIYAGMALALINPHTADVYATADEGEETAGIIQPMYTGAIIYR